MTPRNYEKILLRQLAWALIAIAFSGVAVSGAMIYGAEPGEVVLVGSAAIVFILFFLVQAASSKQ